MVTMKRKMKHLNENRGFIRVIATLILILVILSLLGLDANSIWFNFFKPIFSFIGNIIVVTANWLVSLLRGAWAVIGAV